MRRNKFENGEAGQTVRFQKGFARAINGLPVTNKDLIPNAVSRYKSLLKENGVPRRDVRQAVTVFEARAYNGNPRITSFVLGLLDEIKPSET